MKINLKIKVWYTEYNKVATDLGITIKGLEQNQYSEIMSHSCSLERIKIKYLIGEILITSLMYLNLETCLLNKIKNSESTSSEFFYKQQIIFDYSHYRNT